MTGDGEPARTSLPRKDFWGVTSNSFTRGWEPGGGDSRKHFSERLWTAPQKASHSVGKHDVRRRGERKLGERRDPGRKRSGQGHREQGHRGLRYRGLGDRGPRGSDRNSSLSRLCPDPGRTQRGSPRTPSLDSRKPPTRARWASGKTTGPRVPGSISG